MAEKYESLLEVDVKQNVTAAYCSTIAESHNVLHPVLFEYCLSTLSLFQPIVYLFLSGIRPANIEVLAGADATISCVVTGITQQLDAVVWRKGGTDVTTLSGSNYVVSPGTYDSNSQTTTLTVKAAANTADSTYTCVITSDEWEITNRETSVILNVFGNFRI